MFFTRVGGVLAWVGLIAGLLRAALGVYVAINLDTPGFDPSRYLFSKSSGEAIDQGVMLVAAAIVFGVVVEISASLRRRPSAD